MLRESPPWSRSDCRGKAQTVLFFFIAFGPTQAVVEKEEKEASEMAMETKAIADDAERDLSQALPALEIAVACLSRLKKVNL